MTEKPNARAAADADADFKKSLLGDAIPKVESFLSSRVESHRAGEVVIFVPGMKAVHLEKRESAPISAEIVTNCILIVEVQEARMGLMTVID